MHINSQRLLSNLDSLAKIGQTQDGGVSRPAFSEADLAGRLWFQNYVEKQGLSYQIDGAANQSAILSCANPSAPALLIGSHLDTVPNGGRYDGTLGVLSGLEVAESLRESDVALPFHLEIINFTDEEGSVLGEFGSQALTGQLTQSKLTHPRGGRTKLEEGLRRLNISEQSAIEAVRDPVGILGYLEVHIEQGKRLEKDGIDVGVVSAIVGIRSARLTFHGQAAHAGTTPMGDRRDASWGAAAFVAKARDLINASYLPGVVNVGNIEIEPRAFNIVPAKATLFLEFRHGTEAQLDQMEEALFALAKTCASDFNLTLDINPADGITSAHSAEKMMQALEAGAEATGLSHTRLLSFAGHDTQAVAPYIPSAMFFVPSVEGISHNPKEFTKPGDCVNAGSVMLNAVLHLAQNIDY